MHCPPSLLHHLSMRFSVNAGQWLRGFKQHGHMAGDFEVNICESDKIVTTICNIHDQFAMKGPSLSRSVGIFYRCVYWNGELCRVSCRKTRKSFSSIHRATDRSRQLHPVHAQRSGK